MRAAQSSRQKIHDPAQEIRHRGDGQDLHAALDHLRLRRVDPQHLSAEYIGAHAQYQRNSHGQDPAVEQHPVHPLLLPYAVILAGEAHAGLGHRVHRHIEEA